MSDYYYQLDLTRSAAPADIKRAYRRLATKYHPDADKSPEAAQCFLRVAEAYDVLIQRARARRRGSTRRAWGRASVPRSPFSFRLLAGLLNRELPRSRPPTRSRVPSLVRFLWGGRAQGWSARPRGR